MALGYCTTIQQFRRDGISREMALWKGSHSRLHVDLLAEGVADPEEPVEPRCAGQAGALPCLCCPGHTMPALNTSELRVYADWALARLANGEDSRLKDAFVRHLQALGCDSSNLARWGWPS